MFFYIDEEKKILYGWTPRCGCTHFKSLYNYLVFNNIITKIDDLHLNGEKWIEDISTINNIEDYITIIVSRNPYKRITSTFKKFYNKINGIDEHVNKYRIENHNDPDVFSFEYFINNFYNRISDRHHFSPQTDLFFNEEIINKTKKTYIYDITNIDYEFLETLYNKQIPDEIKNYRGEHININEYEINYPIYNLDVDEIYNAKIDHKYFYNEEIKNKVYRYYKNDFEFFKKYNINYDINI